jgi:hypothetical protein
MADRLSFQLPESLELVLTEDSLTLKHDGDIVLGQTLGRYLETIACEQNVTIRIPRITGTILAAGDIRIEGEIDAELIYGRHVVIIADSIKCKAIAATHTLTIRSTALTCDVIIAPKVNLANRARGRVTMLESYNTCDTSQLKGGFSYKQYQELFGNAEAFLAARGLEPMTESPPESELDAFDPDAPFSAVALPEITEFEPIEEDEDEDTIDGEGELLAFHMAEVDGPALPIQEVAEPAPPMQEVAPPAPPEPPEAIDDSTPAETVVDEIDILTEQTEEVEILFHPDIKSRLSEAIASIVSCYPNGNTPPALEDLKNYVENDDFIGLRHAIGDVWNSVLSYHSEQGIRPDRKVTHVFNLIHGIVGGA